MKRTRQKTEPQPVQPSGPNVAIVSPNRDFALSHAFDLRIQESRVIVVRTAAEASAVPLEARIEFARGHERIAEIDEIRRILANRSDRPAAADPPRGPLTVATATSTLTAEEQEFFRQLATEAKEKFRDRGWTGYGLFVAKSPGKPPQLLVCRNGHVKYRAFRHPTQGIWFAKQNDVQEETEWSDQL